MLNKLKNLNKDIAFFDVHSPEFAEYGRVIEGMDVSEICETARQIEMPHEGSVYQASVESFEALYIAKQIEDNVFGTLPAQIGYCYGHSNMLNATEWHACSELNIAVTPLVLILGKRSDIKDGRLDSADMKAFYVPEGTVIEVYATTLHFCPCEVSADGFGCVVGLSAGTNIPLDVPTSDKLLFRKNKWLLAHEDNTALIAKGVVAGIFGENYKINY